MKILLILLLLTTLSFAQYSNNFINGGGAESFTGTADDEATDDWPNWNETSVSDPDNVLEATVNSRTGSYAFKIKRTTGVATLYQSSAGSGAWEETVASLTWYRFEAWTRSSSGTYAGRFRVIDNTLGGTWNPADSTWGSTIYNNFTGNTTTYAKSTQYFKTQDGTLDLWFTFISAVAPGTYYMDDVSVRQRLDSLFVYSTGTSTKFDTTNTLADAFESRGTHATGTVLTESGTYSESITIDNSFAEWSARGGNVTITAVDFDSKTLSDLDARIAKNITTPTNYSNVTVNFDSTLTTQATGLSFSNITGSKITISWVRGDGDSVLVVLKSGVDPTDPSNDNSYAASAVFGSGDDIGNSSYVVYAGTGTSVNVTGLVASTTYYVNIFEYDQALNNWQYLGTPLSGNQRTTATDYGHKDGYKKGYSAGYDK